MHSCLDRAPCHRSKKAAKESGVPTGGALERPRVACLQAGHWKNGSA